MMRRRRKGMKEDGLISDHIKEKGSWIPMCLGDHHRPMKGKNHADKIRLNYDDAKTKKDDKKDGSINHRIKGKGSWPPVSSEVAHALFMTSYGEMLFC